MANYQDIAPLGGQNFSTSDPELGRLRAQLHQTRRELGRVRLLPISDRTTKMIERLVDRETLLATIIGGIA